MFQYESDDLYLPASFLSIQGRNKVNTMQEYFMLIYFFSMHDFKTKTNHVLARSGQAVNVHYKSLVGSLAGFSCLILVLVIVAST